MTAAIDLDSLQFARNSSTEISPQLRHFIEGTFTLDASGETSTVNG
jgi:hypothetical protein